MTGVGFVELPPWYPPWRGDDWGNNVVYCNNFTVTDEDGEPGGTTVFGGAFNLIFNNKINDADGAIVMSPFNGYNIGRRIYRNGPHSRSDRRYPPYTTTKSLFAVGRLVSAYKGEVR